MPGCRTQRRHHHQLRYYCQKIQTGLNLRWTKWDRDDCTSQGYDFCHRGSHRDWGQLYHRRSCHHREQVWLYAHDDMNAAALASHHPPVSLFTRRRKEVMRIGDDNLFEIGCRASCPVDQLYVSPHFRTTHIQASNRRAWATRTRFRRGRAYTTLCEFRRIV